MTQTPYLKMIDRMNKNASKHAPTPALVNFLSEIYTEEQAALIGDYPFGAYTPKALSEKLDRDADELKEMLEEMSAEGLIFEAPNEYGDPEYSVLAFEPGLMEFHHLKPKDEAETQKFLELSNQMREESRPLFEAWLKNPEEAQKSIKEPALRALAIEEHVANDKELASWESITEIVENETSYAVSECGCKHGAQLRGEPCKSEASSECCIWFGKLADYLVERDYATRYEKEVVYQRLKECEEAGLVHFIGNRMTPNVVICNCCKCCCHYLKSNKLAREVGVQMMGTSNFVSRVDEESCSGCEECVDICQLEALTMEDDTVNVNEEHCVGCGACVTKCPTESLSLERISNKKPKTPYREVVGSGV